jgi:hypothetical protein
VNHLPPPNRTRLDSRISFRAFVVLALLLVGLGILRSAIATRLDSFTIDEAYHIAAGITYVRFGDFRVNPEHPPLVKLWVGSIVAATGFNTQPLRQFTDKPDERYYAQEMVYLANDPDSVQRRARAAMFALNGLLLLAFSFALRREFNSVVALGTLLVLIVDPTVAAHWPVVMTDLPVALLSAIAIVLAARAFHTWLWVDVAACTAFLGLALTAKHSAPVVLLIVVGVGVCAAILRSTRKAHATRIDRLLKIAVLAAGALAILWAAYHFRYAETRTGEEAFNRPILDKIDDVDTPGYHAVLRAMYVTRVVPRAYLWGFADTVHAGMEGRLSPQLIFGRIYFVKGPKYFFPAIIAVKLPIGILVLIAIGIGIFFTRRLRPEWISAAELILIATALFFLVLAGGATYAGVRHAMPVVVLLIIFAGFSIEYAVVSGSRAFQALVALAFLAACVSALPRMRPWEYFNEFVGGPANAYKLFSDEGVDLGQRTKEITAYIRTVVAPTGEIPEIDYWSWEQELKARGVDYLGRDPQRDSAAMSNPTRTGTYITAAQWLQDPFFSNSALWSATPVQRFGNVMIYRGTFDLPGAAGTDLYHYGINKIYTEKPDPAAAEAAWRRAVELAPKAFFIDIELANLALKRGERDAALAFYKAAFANSPDHSAIRKPIQEQIDLLTHSPSGDVPPLRNPFLE